VSDFDLFEPCDEQRFLDASYLPALDWPAWSEADEVALTAALVAADPALRVEPAAAEVVSSGEGDPR